MKCGTRLALASGVAQLIGHSSALGAPVLTVISTNTTHTFLASHNLQSAVIGVKRFAMGENLQGFIGTPDTPWTITCSSGTFFNVDELGDSGGFNPMGQMAASVFLSTPASAFDSGTLASTVQLGGIVSGGSSNAIGFAQYNVGQNSGPCDVVAWLTLQPNGLATGASLNLIRLTWSRDASATVSMLLVTNTGGGNGFEYPVSLTIPEVPAPGSPALCIFALLNGRRRRSG